MTKIVQIPAIIDKVESNDDNSAKVKIFTREIKPEVFGYLFSLNKKEVWLAVSEIEMKPEDIEVAEVKVERNEKTPSQRLRATLFVLWEQTKQTTNFEQYYREKMEDFINKVKEKLDQ